MTDPIRPTDEELTGRIQRSMDHYRLEAPLPSTVLVRARPAWRAGTLLAAGLAGAVLTLALLSVGDRLRAPGDVGGPSPNQSSGATASPAPTPGPTDVPVAAAREECLPQHGIVPVDWLQFGESEQQVRDHFLALPLLVEWHDQMGSLFVFGDDLFVAVCTFEGRPGVAAFAGGFHLVREQPERAVMAGGSFSGGGSVDDDGNPDPANPPEMLLQGFATDDVERVEVALADGTSVEATLAGGVWVAWWHLNVGTVEIRAFGMDGELVETVPHTMFVPAPAGPDGVEFSLEPSPDPS
jgi:hypothetical protein